MDRFESSVVIEYRDGESAIYIPIWIDLKAEKNIDRMKQALEFTFQYG